jgi:hypothetical protein
MKMAFLDALVVRLEGLVRSLDEVAWRRRRDRIAGGALLLAFLLATQTALVHNPHYVIGALYHERRALNLGIQDMTPKERAKLLERLCLAQALFRQGGSDPYKIDAAQACAEAK